MNEQHELINGTLEATDKGVIARCRCGWTSGYHFSSLAASAAMMDHCEAPPPNDRQEASRQEMIDYQIDK